MHDNPLFTTSISINAMPIVETIHAVGELVEDWSRCRSPARAKRRERRGFRQHVRRFNKPACYEANGTFYIHPTLAADMRKEMKRRIDKRIDNDIMAAFQMGNAGLSLSRMGYRFK